MAIDYRKDVDGLRAISIIPVVLFHCGYSLFPGGYVGVDVFFVISGYLITTLILREAIKGTFSFVGFYERRVRRLLPAALMTYAVVMLAFMFIYPMVVFDKVLNAGFSTVFFVSNIFFWKQGGYFTQDLEINPLLHTWSLSVEEQFYFFYPVAIFLAIRHFQNRLLILFALLLLAASLTLAVYYAPPRGSFAAYYLLPTRFYELGAGALAALLCQYYPDNKVRYLPFLKEFGVSLILFSVFVYDKRTPFPSFYAVVPVLGAAMVLLSRSTTGVANWLLTTKALVSVGLISYSLYLWHWPVIVFMNWVSGSVAENSAAGVLCVTFSLILAYLSYRYIEKPVRNKNVVGKRALWSGAAVGACTVLLLMVALKFVGNNALVDPSGDIQRVYVEGVSPEPFRDDCTDVVRNSGAFHGCTMPGSIRNGAKRIFVWGDSHGSALMPAFESLSDAYQVDFSNTTGCPPFLQIDRVDISQECIRVNKQVFEHILSGGYDLVVFVGAFNNYLNRNLVARSSERSNRNVGDAVSAMRQAYIYTKDSLERNGSKTLVFLQPPRFNKRAPDEYLRARALGRGFDGVPLDRAQYEQQRQGMLSVLSGMNKDNIFDLVDFYCLGRRCSAGNNEQLFFKDDHHVSNYYARAIGPKIRERIDLLLEPVVSRTHIAEVVETSRTK